MISYEGNVFRPPSEANSLILQATLGCSWNRCTFCSMYRDKKFRVRSLDDLKREIQWAKDNIAPVRKVFLADGDALMAKASFLEDILDQLADAFPHLQRVSVYASPQSLQVRTVEEMTMLREKGLRLYYVGLESGDDATLLQMDKGVDAKEWERVAGKAHQAGVKLSAMILLGVGGKALSHQHAMHSANLVNAIQPRFLSTLVTTPYPETPLIQQVETGEISMLSEEELHQEFTTFLGNLELHGTIFRSNHVSNRSVLAGNFPKDKEALLSALEDSRPQST
ncbi:MAG: radical SAM protein [Planctomycetota bacterium]|jgi:radical SAM superfamily enzyme YgiQ (UPF0313 family)|nr:radical SAM protein [Planctomycetota bacterium]